MAEEFQHLTAEQAAEKAVNRLAFHFRRFLDVTDLDAVRHGLLRGQLNGVDLLQEAMGAVAKLKKDEFAQALKTKLRHLKS